jgi:diguanylate cyclase (GGDEF)-like protein
MGPRRLWYAVAGAALALGAPSGLMAVRLAGGEAALGRGIRAELERERSTYAYVTASTLVVFTLFGYAMGRAADALLRLSRTDPLTGLGNRLAFEEGLAQETSRAARYGGPVSLLAVDVDGLKNINDRHGHRAGDLALQAVAQALRGGARGSDLAARLGGDEFALLAPSTPAAAALALAERVRSLVAAGPPGGLTVSVGLATAEGSAATAGSLREAADGALYEAKRRGRNCVVSSA